VIRRLAAGAGALLLAACAALPPAEAPAPRLTEVPRSFEMNGRIAVRTADRSDIATLRWTRHGASDTWVIVSPLGNQVARIESTPEGATLVQGEGGDRHAASFQALTRKLLGVAIDPDWLAEGLVGKTPANLPPGWKFMVDETQDAGVVHLARRITASKGDTVVRLLVDGFRALPD
jgi:outer membrane biogenesis lipoprotein LolB